MTTIPKEVFEKIIQAGALAPSGENCQPWKFLVRNNQIFVFNLPERDLSVYNYKQRGALVAHGALIENMVTAASAMGYLARIDLLPDKNDSNCVSTITLNRGEPERDTLYPFIHSRTTNRKPYKTRPLTSQHKKELENTQEEVSGGKVILVDVPEQIELLANASSINERVMFENPQLYNFFYSHITWTKEEDEKKKIGFYVKTLEMPFPAQKGLRFFSSWKLLNLINKVGFSKAVANQNAKNYASCAAMGIVWVPSNTDRDFIISGRIMERIWLKVTKMGLSLQPLTGVLFLMQRIFDGETSNFLPYQVALIQKAYADIGSSFGVKKGTIAMMFRIGDGGSPTARASRLAPEVRFE